MFGKKKTKMNPGDVIIGYDKYTGEPNVIPNTDRLLHTLIIGKDKPKKISNTILPMIEQDLKNLETGVIIVDPNGEIYKEAISICRKNNRKILCINPLEPNGLIFNPFFGDESDVIENFADMFKASNHKLTEFAFDVNDIVIRNSIKLLKRLKGNNANLLDLDILLNNAADMGKKMVMHFDESSSPEDLKENSIIVEWFLNYYYPSINEKNNITSIFKESSLFRSQIGRMINSEYIRNVVIPPTASKYEVLDFNSILEEGTAIAISTQNESIGEVGSYLGYLVMGQFQFCVYRRPGNAYCRRKNMVYIEDFELYATQAFSVLLTQGRSYSVALHLSTSTIGNIRMKYDNDEYKGYRNFVDDVTRNKIIYPSSYEDAKHYEQYFANIIERYKKEDKGLISKVFFKCNEDDFSADSIFDRELGEFVCVVSSKNRTQFPKILKGRKNIK